MGLTTCSLQRSRRQKLCCGLKNVPDAIVMAMIVTTVVAEMTRTATDRAQTYAAARRASSTARNAPAAVMDTRTENATAFVAAAATKTTTIRRPVSAASATDPTYESRTTGTRSDRTTNRRRMQRVERSIGRSSPDPVSSRLTDTTTRGRGAPPCLVHATRSRAALSHAWRSLGAPARAAAQSRRGVRWPTLAAGGGGGARAPWPRNWSSNACSSAPENDDEEDEEEEEEEEEAAAAPSWAGSPICMARGAEAWRSSQARALTSSDGRTHMPETGGHA